MPKIVVIGAGIGGIPMAFELREMLGRSADITVVSDTDYFHFVPSNPWVAVGWRRPKDIKIALPDIFAKKRIAFSSAGAKRVVPDENKIYLGDGTSLDYDYLVIATGPKLAFDEVEGLGPQGHTQSICHVDHADGASKQWEAFCDDPGPMVVGAVQGASCFGPAYEYALCAVTDLRKRKIRHKVPMTFVTSEPYIGHLGLGGVGDTKGMLESIMRDRDIKWITNCKIDRINADSVEATEVNEDGSVKRTHKLPSKFSMFLPAFRGVDCFRTDDGKWIEGLTNPRGFILIDKHQRNPKYRNVFAVGVCTAIPPVEQTPVPTGTPKTGYLIETMVTCTAHNIADLIANREPTHEGTWNAVCLADFGDSGVAFVALPQIPPRNVNWSSQGYWVHLAKIAFEKYFLRKIRTGSSEPGYERFVMKKLGCERLKQPAGKHAS
ncbi:FAD/NAD(P)-binding oxidoreductase [Methylocapsa polymorpha]|uniref:FAD/NAD(P)-binding oxidoreductase n=1 Tax=Methylocapsa polymorpha TaxID=3080828 RepID=A0ABZ0HSS8_9HYPH|nr:FAD/NAD(P)-binding oxidoreductase [Methylocapsa sp. RX1]